MVRRYAIDLASRLALASFQRTMRRASRANRECLIQILSASRDTAIGRELGFRRILRAPDPLRAYREQVPLSSYARYEQYIDRIAAGETGVLTADPVHMLARSSGTTDRPKLIPRTRRAQRHQVRLVVFAESAVIRRDIPAMRSGARGINLMSLYAPPPEPGAVVPVMSGPNAGMRRLRSQIPALFTSPVAAFEVADQAAALYLHALFGLRDPNALFIETPFAPKVVGWFALLERNAPHLVQDLACGTVAPHVALTASEREAVEPHLVPDPSRAAEVATAIAGGWAGIVPRLWPGMACIKAITSGSFALSLPRLRWLAGPEVAIHSGGYTASEGIIGINLAADGGTHYALAVGTGFFEFVPLALADDASPVTVAMEDLAVGQDYEVVMTSWAGLYRYRLGDVVRVQGWAGEAPLIEFLYRRGTILNLVGEKTTECQTQRAVTAAIACWLGRDDAVRDYAVAGDLVDGRGQYTFFVELQSPGLPERADRDLGNRLLDDALCQSNPFYAANGRLPERMARARLRLVGAGTFDDLAELQSLRTGGVNTTQTKTPRVVSVPEQRDLLESRVLGSARGVPVLRFRKPGHWRVSETEVPAPNSRNPRWRGPRPAVGDCPAA